MAAPDLSTLEGQLDFLNWHRPDDATAALHKEVNEHVQWFWRFLGPKLPDGPGKLRVLHAVNEVRMQANNCIANEGA